MYKADKGKMDRRNTTAVALLAAIFGALAVAAPVAIRNSAL
jgi:hypothetical protein